MMFIDKPEVATFVHVPKAAGTSIKFWLRDNFDARIPTIREQNPHSTDGSLIQGFSFCCVRNPWSRMFSTFNWLYRHGGGKLGRQYGNIHDKESFTKFLDDLDNENLKPFTIPQLYFIEISDYVMRFETLEKDFKLIQKRFNCYEPLELKNKAQSYIDKYAYKHNYTDENKEKVYSKFQEEIELLGYTFEK